ncbi:MAG: kelch repeat-containing protein [Terriglobales bacterium]
MLPEVRESGRAVPSWFSYERLVFRFDSRRSATRILVVLSALAATLFLASCGSSGQGTQAPILSYSTTNAVYTKGTAIAPNTPTDTGGAATSYTVTPALPAGLSLNSATGVISGTPTAVTTQATYTVTASNAGGNFSVSLIITVNDIAPAGLTYSLNPAVYAAAAAITPDTPSWSAAGGTPTSFGVTGYLPQGLSLDPTTGILSGTPAAQTAQQSLTVTAANTGGSTSTTLTVTVIPQAPYFIVQPASQYVGSGISTSFGVNVGGGGSLSFQWYKNAAAIGGTNSNVYTTPVLSSADNGEQFYVVVSDNYNRSVTSNVATITIKGVSGTFVNTGTPNLARDCHTATLLQNGMVLITGGRSGNNTLSSAELYDPTTGNFTFTGSLLAARCDHSATLLQNGTVLIAGGYYVGSGLPTLAAAELYDPTTGTFSSTGSLGTARYGHSATLLTDGKVLVAGGVTSSDGYTFVTIASAELYDPVAGTFSATGSLNTARSAPATLLENGQVLVAGGSSISAGAPFASAEIYDPTAGTFSFTGSLITARSGNSSTLLQDGKVLIAGGAGANNAVLSGELYDASAGTFSDTGSLNFGRSGSATLLTNGQVLLVGGGADAIAQTLLNSSELYDPASGLFILNASTNFNRFFMSATLLNSGQVLITGQETSAITVTQPNPSELYQP